MKQWFAGFVDRVGGFFKGVKLTGALGVVWAWVSWAVVGLVRSIYNLWLAPKVWPAAITFFLIGWVMAFNLGQKVPEVARAYGLIGQPQPIAVKTVVDRGAVQACAMQRDQLAREMTVAQTMLNEATAKISTLEAKLAEKPKVVYRRVPTKDDPNVIKLRLPTFE